jgi:predicted glycosyltransferase
MKRPSLLFYCQHSLGMGHLMRSLALTRSLATQFNVTLVVGGRIPAFAATEHIRVVRLPPVGMDETGALVSRDRRRTLARALDERRRLLLQTFRLVKPNVLVIELYPFGRRKFAAELEPLLDEAWASTERPMVCCSIRDILIGRREQQSAHDRKAADLVARRFDCVLVHSDARIATLQESLSPDVTLGVPVHHTGFVHEPARAEERPRLRQAGLVVSAGGGLVGEKLFHTALDAQALTPKLARRPMTIVTGPFFPDDAWRTLKQRATEVPGTTVRRSVPRLAVELKHAVGSISQCGYNTALDLLDSRVPALVVPFGGVGEDEQTKRARRLEALGLLRVVAQSELTPLRLAAEMTALPTFTPSAVSMDLGGAERTTEIIAATIGGREVRSSHPYGQELERSL